MASNHDDGSGFKQNGPGGNHGVPRTRFRKAGEQPRWRRQKPKKRDDSRQRGPLPNGKAEDGNQGRTGRGAAGTTRRVRTTKPAADRPSLLFVSRVGSGATATVDPGRVDPTIRTCAVGDGTPTGTRSRKAGSFPGRPKTVLNELANALLRKRQPKRQNLTYEPRTRDPELRGEPVDAAQLPAGEPDPDRSIERLQVATGNRHGSLRLVWRKVGVPVVRDVGGIHTTGEHGGQGLGNSVIEIVRTDGKRASMSVEDIAESVGVRPLTRNPNALTEDRELGDGILDRQERRRSWLRRTATRRSTSITQTVLMIAPEILGRSTQAPINSSTDDG